MNDHPPSLSERVITRMAVGVLILWLILHALWFVLDQTPLLGDQVGYAIGAMNLIRAWQESWQSFWVILDDATETLIRPPGASLLLVPGLLISNFDIFFTNVFTVLWFGLAMLAIFKLSQLAFNQSVGLMACLMLISMPSIYAISIDPEVYFIALVPLALLCCYHLFDPSPWRWVWWLGMGFIVALGLLLKWLFVVYLLGPMLLMSWRLLLFLKHNPERRTCIRLLANGFLMLLPVALVAWFWYLPNLEVLLSAFDEIARSKQFTPFKQGWTWLVPFHYIEKFFWQNKFFPSLMIAIGFITMLLPHRWLPLIGGYPEKPSERDGINLLLSCVLGFWLYFAIRYENIPVKYIYGLLPVLAIVAVYWVGRLPQARVRVMMHSVIIGYALFCTGWMHFAPSGWLGPSNLPRVVHLTADDTLKQMLVPVSRQPQPQSWPHEAIVQAISQVEENDHHQKHMVVTPDLYFYNWRNMKVALRKTLPHVEPEPLFPQNGLFVLHQAEYILTSRGRVSRLPFAMRQQDSAKQSTVALNRLIDRAPQWFWDHYELVDTFTIPYALDELHLYRRTQPGGQLLATQWINFWLAFHVDQKETWEQIRGIWRYEMFADRAAWADQIIQHLNGKKELYEIEINNTLEDYQALQLISIYLKENQIEQAQHLWQTQFNNPTGLPASMSQWRAALLLAEWLLSNQQYAEAETYIMHAWQLFPERPEAIQLLAQLYTQWSQPDQQALFRQLIPLNIGLLDHNRRPGVYQEISQLLLNSEFSSEALWYAQQAFVTGLNRLPNTIHLVNAQKATNSFQPDYERVSLPIQHNLINKKNENIVKNTDGLSSGPDQSYVYPFLNLEEGVHSLRLKSHISQPQASLTLSLDDSNPLMWSIEKINQKLPMSSHQYNTDTLDLPFYTLAWKDRLRLTAHGMSGFDAKTELIKVFQPINLSEGTQPAIRTRLVDHITPLGTASWRIQPTTTEAIVDFSVHTDPRAWDYLFLETNNLSANQATLTLSLRDGERIETQHLRQSHVFEEWQDFRYHFIPVPDGVIDYPFLTHLRIHLQGLHPKQAFTIKRAGLVREAYLTSSVAQSEYDTTIKNLKIINHGNQTVEQQAIPLALIYPDRIAYMNKLDLQKGITILSKETIRHLNLLPSTPLLVPSDKNSHPKLFQVWLKSSAFRNHQGYIVVKGIDPAGNEWQQQVEIRIPKAYAPTWALSETFFIPPRNEVHMMELIIICNAPANVVVIEEAFVTSAHNNQN